MTDSSKPNSKTMEKIARLKKQANPTAAVILPPPTTATPDLDPSAIEAALEKIQTAAGGPLVAAVIRALPTIQAQARAIQDASKLLADALVYDTALVDSVTGARVPPEEVVTGERVAWWCPRCNRAPPLNELALPEPPMHTLCQCTCARRTIMDATGGPAKPPLLPKARDITAAAVAEPAKPKPPTMG